MFPHADSVFLQDERKEAGRTSTIETLADEAAKPDECDDGNPAAGGVDTADTGEGVVDGGVVDGGVDTSVSSAAYTHAAAEEDAAAAIHAAAAVTGHDGGEDDDGEDDGEGDGDGDGDGDPRQGVVPGDGHHLHGGAKGADSGPGPVSVGGGLGGGDMLDPVGHIGHQAQQAGAAEASPGGELAKGKRPPGRPKGAKDSRPRTRRRKAEISAIRNATSAGLPVGGMGMAGMGFGHHHPVFSPHHHLAGGHDLGFQGMHGVDMGYGRPGAGFQSLRGMWPGGDPSMGPADGSMGGGPGPGGHALSYKTIADPSRGLGPGGDVWQRGMSHAAAAAAQGFADPSAHMGQMYGGGGGGSMDPYGFQGRGGGGMYGSDGAGHYDGRYAAAAQPYGMSMMSMPGGGGGGGMGMKPPGQSHVPGGHAGRPHGYGQLGRMDDGQDGSQDQQVRRALSAVI
jgi:hypothetical protein